jgi:hypothetical protein
MLAFEISLNGKKLCVAGIDDRGVLSSIVTWATRRSTGVPETADESCFLQVGGLLSRTEEYVDWVHQEPLAIGDEIHLRIVETNSADVPIRKRSKREIDPKSSKQ